MLPVVHRCRPSGMGRRDGSIAPWRCRKTILNQRDLKFSGRTGPSVAVFFGCLCGRARTKLGPCESQDRRRARTTSTSCWPEPIKTTPPRRCLRHPSRDRSSRGQLASAATQREHGRTIVRRSSTRATRSTVRDRRLFIVECKDHPARNTSLVEFCTERLRVEISVAYVYRHKSRLYRYTIHSRCELTAEPPTASVSASSRKIMGGLLENSARAPAAGRLRSRRGTRLGGRPIAIRHSSMRRLPRAADAATGTVPLRPDPVFAFQA